MNRLVVAFAFAALATALAVAGPDSEAVFGVKLTYRVRPDRSEAALTTIRARLKRMMPGGDVTARLKDEKTLVVLSRSRAKKVVNRIKWIVTKPGMLEFRITVEREQEWDEFDRALKSFQKALKKGVALDRARTIPVADLTDNDREQFPDGLRWFRLHAKANKHMKRRAVALKDGTHWFLVRLDRHKLTEGDLRKVSVWLDTSGFDETYAINFQVRESAWSRMAALTAIDDDSDRSTYMAIVMDGRVLSAPRLNSSLRSTASITGGFTENEAKALALPLRSAILDPVPVFVSATAEQFAPKAEKVVRKKE